MWYLFSNFKNHAHVQWWTELFWISIAFSEPRRELFHAGNCVRSRILDVGKSSLHVGGDLLHLLHLLRHTLHSLHRALHRLLRRLHRVRKLQESVVSASSFSFSECFYGALRAHDCTVYAFDQRLSDFLEWKLDCQLVLLLPSRFSRNHSPVQPSPLSPELAPLCRRSCRKTPSRTYIKSEKLR